MKDDLKEAGFNPKDLAALNETKNPYDEVSEDSADCRRRKALEPVRAPGAPYDKPKIVPKKEKARIAYRAERARQKILRPKSKEPQSMN